MFEMHNQESRQHSVTVLRSTYDHLHIEIKDGQEKGFDTRQLELIGIYTPAYSKSNPPSCLTSFCEALLNANE